MDRILDFFKGLPAKAVEFWNKYTSKQKTIIISVLAVVIFTLVALIWFSNRTTYVTLATFESTTDAAAAKKYLDESGKTFKYQISSDALTISIDEKQLSEARLVVQQWFYHDGFGAAVKGKDYTAEYHGNGYPLHGRH